MKRRKILNDIYWAGAIDWDRRLFDSLIPLPDGTSYNAYLIRGSEKTALIDTVDPSMTEMLFSHIEDVPRIDYVIANHAEQDHSGSIPSVLAAYENAKVVASSKCKEMLKDHLMVPEDRIIEVKDFEELSLGNKTLKFIYTPWVHWPETMVTYLEQDKILFTCDFFGSHLATSDLFATDEGRVSEAAKRYYGEIMMPFRTTIRKNIEKISGLKIEMIAPSHGPIYDKPSFIIDAYKDWVSDTPKNIALIPYVSMHGSTRKMVQALVCALGEQGVEVHQFDLAVTDIGKLVIGAVDAATLVVGTPTVHVGPHPLASQAAYLINALRPKIKFATVIGSYGWSSKAVEHIGSAIQSLHAKMLDPVICKGYPREADFKAIDALADTIAKLHRENIPEPEPAQIR